MTVTSLTLDAHGVGTAKLYPGKESGTATLLAQVETSVSQLNLPIRQSTISIQSILPTLGVAEGGDTVSIQGGGFVAPVRVTFGGVVAPQAKVQSPTLLQVKTPRSPQAVPANTTLTVSVTVTAGIDQTNPASDTLSEGFTY